MYEKLTAYIPRLQADTYGQWITDNENDGTPDHTTSLPYVEYSDAVRGLMKELYDFHKNHPEFDLVHYMEILDKNGIKHPGSALPAEEMLKLDAQTTLALLFWPFRADRFSPGALIHSFKNGSILACLKRLQELDEGRAQ